MDTSFSRHNGRVPEQVFPQQAKPQEVRFINLLDVQSLRDDFPPVPISKEPPAARPQLSNTVYVPPSWQCPTLFQNASSPGFSTNALGISHDTNLPPPRGGQQTSAPSMPLVHKRIKGIRPAPLQLSSEISPSDRAIPIGIQMSPSSLLNSRNGLTVEGHETQHSARELPTPTIVITPAKEDFERPFNTSPEEMFRRPNARPTSSVYSRYTSNANDTTNGRTPPVPPLPLFAAQSNASLRQTSLDLSHSHHTENGASLQIPGSRNKSALSLRTVTEDEQAKDTRTSTAANSKRLTAGSMTSRHSKGWWNVITSPFSPSGIYPGSFLRSPTADDDQDGEMEPILSEASPMGRLKLSDIIIRSRETADDELRSAPGASTTFDCARTVGSQRSRNKPKRSGTAPGALDRGSAEKVNIYRQPSKGAARAYFDSRGGELDRPRSFTAERGLADDDWSPSQSVYRASTPFLGLRESEFYAIPGTGEAAGYYDSNKRFPSLPPDGLGDREIGWDSRDSVAHPTEEGSRSPGDVSTPLGGSESRFSLSESGGSLTPRPRSTTLAPPYPVNTDPFNDSHAAQYDDLGQGGPRGYAADLTPSSGDVSAFKDFSATHPAASFPETPDVRLSCGNPRPDAQRNASDDMYSPLLETPLVEEARTATIMGPESHREVEVGSAKLRKSPGYGAGLGAATMASRDASETGYAGSINSMSDDSDSDDDYDRRPINEAAGFGYFADNRDRPMKDSSYGFSEKEVSSRANLNQSDDPGQEAKRPWYRRFARLLIAIAVLLLLGLLALLLVLFVPWQQSNIPIEAAWLNLTGFPPLPTGVATVINPKAVQEIDGCTSQQGLWSCGLSASDPTITASSQQKSPEFRFQISFRDNILPSNETAIQPSNITLSRRSLGHASGASNVARRNIFTSPLWTSSPAAPTLQDQEFLGRTTDNVSAPYDGEQTPFYITLLNASALTDAQSSRLRKRDSPYPYPTGPSSSTNTNSSNLNISQQQQQLITQLEQRHTGHPTCSNHDRRLSSTHLSCIPSPTHSPLRLYDRGLSSEHYGFYTYFDRALYISDAANGTVRREVTHPFSSAVTSNTPLDSSTAVCTWSQTRLLGADLDAQSGCGVVERDSEQRCSGERTRRPTI